jgi:hypothetical protein
MTGNIVAPQSQSADGISDLGNTVARHLPSGWQEHYFVPAPRREDNYIFLQADRPNTFIFIVPSHTYAPMNPVATSARESVRAYPDHMYVDVPTFTKAVSSFVLLISIFSLIIGGFTHFNMIQPFVSAVIAFASAVFFVMGMTLKREWTN